jgi:hypothetical protein
MSVSWGAQSCGNVSLQACVVSPHVRNQLSFSQRHSLDVCSPGTSQPVYKTARRHFPNRDIYVLVVLLFWFHYFVCNCVAFCCPCGVPFVWFCVRHLLNAVGHVLLHANCWGVDLLSLLLNRVKCSDNHSFFLDVMCHLGFFNPLSPSGHYMYSPVVTTRVYVPPV